MALLLVSQHKAAHYVGGKYAGITQPQYLTSILGVVGKGNLLNITGCDFIVMLRVFFFHLLLVAVSRSTQASLLLDLQTGSWEAHTLGPGFDTQIVHLPLLIISCSPYVALLRRCSPSSLLLCALPLCCSSSCSSSVVF